MARLPLPNETIMNRFLSALLLATTALACAPDLDKTSDGEKGRLGFSLRSGSCLIFGCELDQKILAGAKMDLRVSSIDPALDYQVRATGAATVGAPSRTCDDAGACQLLVTLDSSAPGDAHVEVVKSDGTVVDAATVHFVAADRIESRIQVGSKELGPGPDGAYPIGAGTSFGIESAAFAGDTELVVGERGFRVAYTNPAVVAADLPGVFDGATREPALARAQGDASVRIATLGGASREIRVRVVP